MAAIMEATVLKTEAVDREVEVVAPPGREGLGAANLTKRGVCHNHHGGYDTDAFACAVM